MAKTEFITVNSGNGNPVFITGSAVRDALAVVPSHQMKTPSLEFSMKNGNDNNVELIDLDYVISGTTLTISGLKCYVENAVGGSHYVELKESATLSLTGIDNGINVITMSIDFQEGSPTILRFNFDLEANNPVGLKLIRFTSTSGVITELSGLISRFIEEPKVFYIDALSGSDGNSGLSLAKAFKTIKKGCDSIPAGAVGTLLLQNGQIFDITEDIYISSKLITVESVDIENVNRPILRHAYTQNPAIYDGGVTYASIAGFYLQNSLFVSRHCNYNLHNPNNVDLTQPMDSSGGMFTTGSVSGNASVSIGISTIDLGSLHPTATCVMGSICTVNLSLLICNVIGSGYVTRNQAAATLNKNFYQSTFASTVIIN